MIKSKKTGFVPWEDIRIALGKAVLQADGQCNCDILGLSIQGNLVDEVGAGISLSIVDVTWGRDRGVYVLGTPSIRAGTDNSASVSTFTGWYIGDSPESSIKDFGGHSIDAGTTEGKHGAISFDNYFAPYLVNIWSKH